MSKIHSLIPLIMAEVGSIAKGRKNAQQGYSFRGIDDAYQAFQPLFAKHGVFCVPTVLKVTREERQTKSGGTLIYTSMEVKHTFFAADASSFDCVTIGEAMDSGDKSSNKAMSAAMKYALLEVFCVPTEADNDTENHSPEPIAKAGAIIPPPPRSAPQAATAETRTKMIKALLDEGIDAATIQEYAVKAQVIDEKGNAEIDWPLNLVPTTKGKFNGLLGLIENFANGGDAVKP